MAKVTKETLRIIYQGWMEGKSVQEIAQQTGLSPLYVRQLATKLRKAGAPLPIRRVARVERVIQDFVNEIKEAANG